MVSEACCGPIETATISVALPASLRRIASSTAISSNGRHFHVGQVDPAAIRFDPDFHVVVDHPLDRDEDLHESPDLKWGV
jgi:hypothetical protein